MIFFIDESDLEQEHIYNEIFFHYENDKALGLCENDKLFGQTYENFDCRYENLNFENGKDFSEPDYVNFNTEECKLDVVEASVDVPEEIFEEVAGEIVLDSVKESVVENQVVEMQNTPNIFPQRLPQVEPEIVRFPANHHRQNIPELNVPGFYGAFYNLFAQSFF